MYRVDSPNIVLKCINFTMPMHTTKNKKGKVVSLSDHEFLLADFLIEKLPPKPDDVQEDVDVTAIEPRPEINKQLAGSKQTVHFDDDEAAAVSQLRIKSHKDINQKPVLIIHQTVSTVHVPLPTFILMYLIILIIQFCESSSRK